MVLSWQLCTDPPRLRRPRPLPGTWSKRQQPRRGRVTHQGCTALREACATSRLSSRRKPTALPASSACFQVRMSCATRRAEGPRDGVGVGGVVSGGGGGGGGGLCGPGMRVQPLLHCCTRPALAWPRGASGQESSLPSCPPARRAHRQAVADDDLVHAGHVGGVGGVKLGSGDPLVGHEDCARLEHAEHLAIHLRGSRGGTHPSAGEKVGAASSAWLSGVHSKGGSGAGAEAGGPVMQPPSHLPTPHPHPRAARTPPAVPAPGLPPPGRSRLGNEPRRVCSQHMRARCRHDAAWCTARPPPAAPAASPTAPAPAWGRGRWPPLRTRRQRWPPQRASPESCLAPPCTAPRGPAQQHSGRCARMSGRWRRERDGRHLPLCCCLPP